MICRLLHNKKLPSYAGKCIGPAYNFLPEDNKALPEYVPVDWLNLGCTIYRKAALQNLPFQNHFTGYSMMEDLTLSLTVGKNYTLLNARTARIFHDSQPGDYKSNVVVLEKMELVNRHYVMTKVLGRTKLTDHLKLFLLEMFFVFSQFQSMQGFKKIRQVVWGKLLGVKQIIFHV